MKKRFNLISSGIYVIGYLIVFASVGLLNLAVAGFDPSILATADYWFRTITNTVTYIIAFQLTMNLSVDINSGSNKLYQDTESEIQKIGREQLDGTFTDFIAEYNFKNKRKTWIELITAKLIKHNEEATDSVLEHLRLESNKWDKKTLKFVAKRDKYKLQLSDKWINENLPFIRIIYPKITPAEVVSGENAANTRGRLIDTNIQGYKLGGRAANIGFSIFLNALANAVFLTGQPFNTGVLAAIIVQLVLLFLNIFLGYGNGIKAFNERVLNAALTRREILVDYLAHKLKTQKVSTNEVK
jgi:hypothetical protein